MFNWNRCAKINVKVLAVLILITVAIASSLFAAREVRRSLLSKMNLDAGQAAFEKEDWATAYKHFQEYLGRNPDDVEVLKKYAKARLSIRPLDAAAVNGAIAAYRRVIQLDPLDEVAYEKLAQLYAGIPNFEELAYIARKRMDLDPNDLKAPLWLAEALNRLRKPDTALETLDRFIKELEPLADKPDEYVQACAIRARIYRQTQDIAGMSEDERLTLARKDLEAADARGTENPRIRLFLGAEWLAHGQLDRAAAELKATESLPQEVLEEHFFDINDWTVIRFLFASELAIRNKSGTEGASLADEALKVLTEKNYRVQVLPNAIMLYVGANRVSDANDCLDEYANTIYTQEGPAESKLQLAYLQALVASAKNKPYVVIDVLQPAVVIGASRPELWRLLAEAFSRTDQTRRAVGALVEYGRLKPGDPEMTLQLAKEYFKLQDWNKAFGAARLAESLIPTDIAPKLLRIEASINVAVEQQKVDPTRLQALADELAQLRTELPDRVDIRILQAMVADYLGQTEKAEEELKLAIKECEESLMAEMQLVRFYYRTKPKRMPEAISTCQEACDHHPDVAEPWIALSGLYVAKADYASARSCLKQALGAVAGKQEKRSVSMSLALLEITHGDKPDQEAGIGLLKELAAQNKEEIRARTLLLSIRKIQEDQETADALIEELKDAEGESGLFWRLHQASLWLASKDDWRAKQADIAEAVQYCINADPEWSAPALLLANMYEKLGDFGRLEETCRQALVRNPSATDVAVVLTTLLERQGRFSDAEKVRAQIETNPRVPSAWSVRVALSAGDFSRAIEELKVRVSNDDRDANSRILLAQLVYRQDKDADQAFALLTEAEAIAPDSMALTDAKVAILRAEGRAEEAQQILNAAEQGYRKLTTFPEKATTGYELLSNFYARSQRLDQAVTALEEGLAAYPADLRLKRQLMKTLFVRGQAQDQQRALEILTALEERLPQDLELMKLRAVQMLQQPTPQSLKTARAKLEDVIKLEPTAVDAHLALIGIAMQEGQYEVARNSAIGALGFNPDNPALLSARAGAELELGNIQMAVQLARLVLEKDSTNSGALGVLLDAALSSGNDSLLGEAIALARPMLAADPNKTEARDVIVAKAVKSKHPTLLKEARSLIESAATTNPPDEKLLLSRARVLAAMELPGAAIPELDAYCQTEKGSGSVPAVVTLADLYRFSGQMDRAKQWIEQAEKLDRNSLAVIHARFLWLVAQKRFGELSQISSAYLSAKEQNPATFVAAATILAASDSMELKREAVKLFEKAATLVPTLKEARLGLASTLYQTGDADRAVTIYEELLRQYPNDKQALNDLAWILQEHDRRFDAALELANRGLVLAPDELHLLDTRGTILANMGNRLDDARKDFERLVQLAPPDSRQKATALLKLGRTCVKLNDLAQAKQHLQDALEIDRKINVFTPDERSEITNILQKSGTQAVNK